jgi:hypothetical protein
VNVNISVVIPESEAALKLNETFNITSNIFIS